MRTIQYFLLLISFFIVAFAQPDWSQSCCIITSCMGYALFWKAVLLCACKKKRFCLAALWFALIMAVHLSWLLSDRYVGIYIYPFLMLLFTCLGAQFGIISVFIVNPREMSIVQMLCLSGGWTLLEWLRLHVLSGFSWNPIGLSLTGTVTGMQMASIMGIFGLSFWVFLTNLLALRFFSKFSWGNGVVWLVILGLPYLFGSLHIAWHSRMMQLDHTPPLSALLVQTSLLPEEKLSINGSRPLSPVAQWVRLLHLLARTSHTFAGNSNTLTADLGTQIDEAVLLEHCPRLSVHQSRPSEVRFSPQMCEKSGPASHGNDLRRHDVIIFPEGVVPYGTDFPIYANETVFQTFKTIFQETEFMPFSHSKQLGNRFWSQSLANATQSDVIIGLEDMDVSDNGEYKAYNAAFLFHPFSQSAERYEKQVLLPMGEYIPFNWCKKILSKYGILSSFTPGKTAKIFDLKKAKAGIAICYEETFGNLMLANKKRGSEMLISLSNDVWFPRSRLPIVHYLHGRLRAVEGGIPLLRACNTGMTCGIDALGRLIGQLPHECAQSEARPGVLSIALPLYHYPTFYSLVGDAVVVYISSFLFASFCLFLFIKKKEFILKVLNIYPLRKN